jgi:hypothetical protein
MTYTIEEHIHRSAAWAAATSARASRNCRFAVHIGKEILEECGFTAKFSLADLPSPESMDARHREWRDAVLKAAKKKGICGFTHGVAAKIINCYLKDRFICGGYHDKKQVKALHPPIDAVLLAGLASAEPAKVKFQSEWKKLRYVRWSNLESDDYQQIIALVRKTMDGQPLWMIEEYWQGHQ